MRLKTAMEIFVVLLALTFGCRPVQAQAATAAERATCMPSAEQVAQTLRAFARRTRPTAQPAPRNESVTAIAGVVDAGAKWTKIWQQGGNSADGILAATDGSVVVAQEDYDTVLRIDANGSTSVAVSGAKGVGSLSMDRSGRLYGALRTERPGSTKPDKDSIVNAIVMLAPEHRMISDKWSDGTALTVRPNDLAADSHGGAYFTTGCLYYASPKGVSVMAGNIRTNGIVFSLDYKTLYVTNGGELVAFDVQGPGRLANRRDFAALPKGSYGDGMAIDSKGRLYVSSSVGVQVFGNTGKHLGVIPTPRGIISVVFSGANKRTLFVVGSGAEDANGQPIRQGPQHTAATIYKLPMIAQGPKGRAK
ncbi:MAG: SMP-30/gluconolactonase/LRE family protein [Candidatus Acidiferrales bacterium]